MFDDTIGGMVEGLAGPATSEGGRKEGRMSTPSRPTRRAQPQPIRLTRRGRVVLIAFAAATLLGLLLLTTHAVSAAATNSGHAGQRSVVARHGDTLWSIAVRTSPHTDPRVTVERLMKVNSLHSAEIQPGQRVWLPGTR